jgi:uncharacterized protein (DUF885 family)
MQARLDAQNALFEEQYQSDLVRRPEHAAAVGDFRYNDRLNDYSLAFVQKQHEIDEAFRTRLAAISTDGFAEQDALSHDLLLRSLKQRSDDFAQHELGAKFDIRAFHDQMLNGGALPLDLLDARTNAWIIVQKGAAKTAANLRTPNLATVATDRRRDPRISPIRPGALAPDLR